MPDESKTHDIEQDVEKAALDAKAMAQAAEQDASDAVIEAKMAESYTFDAVQKAEIAAMEAKAASKTMSGPDEESLLQAGHAIIEAKDAIQIAESAREQAEFARNKAEDSRFLAEDARNKAEEARLEAEDTRSEAEVTRDTEEEARIRALESRRKAEEAKLQAEAALKSSKEAIMECEHARLEAERARDKALQAAKGLQEYAFSLEALNKDLEQFATVASHDLQAPLRKIRSFSARIEEEASSKLSPENLDSLRRICTSAQSMQELITDLLALARVSGPEVFAPVELSSVVKDVISKLDEQIAQMNAMIEVGTMVTVMGDKSQLQQLFQNLIENALKFQPQGATPVIKISSTCPDEAHCRVIVEDNGIGFDQQQAEHIFAPFKRLPGVSQFPGTGMGLAICKRIAERHGGNITVSSVPVRARCLPRHSHGPGIPFRH